MERIMLTISAGEWEGIQHRPHHFMRRSANSGWQVLYVEPPATLIAPLKNKQMLTRWKSWLKGVRHVEQNIYVISPPPILPFGNKYRIINKINQRLTALTIKRALRRLPKAELDLYTFLPGSIDLLPYFKFNKIVYDCVDDHASFTGLINKNVVNQMEKEIMNTADLSLATARKLLEDRKAWSTNLHLVPNGAEFEHFNQVKIDKIPAELENVQKPIVGFIGGISDWIDIPLLTGVVSQLPDYTFIFIGPIGTNVDSLKGLPNVKFLGTKPYMELPAYIQQFDTCLIPFKINELTASVNPIKMFEYLSAGKPVVSTPLPEVISYNSVVEIAGSEQEMINAINKTILAEMNTADIIALRTQVGKQNSWDARWDRIKELIISASAKEKELNVSR